MDDLDKMCLKTERLKQVVEQARASDDWEKTLQAYAEYRDSVKKYAKAVKAAANEFAAGNYGQTFDEMKKD